MNTRAGGQMRSTRRGFSLRWLVYSVLGLVLAAQVAGAQSTPHRPVLELLLEVPLGHVAEDQIPDLSEAGWALKVTFSKPIVVPDGSKVLVVTADDMQMYGTSDGELLWKQPIYGGIDKYDATNDIVYLSEAGVSGQFKERSYIYAKVSDSWKDGSVTDRTEVLVALDDEGARTCRGSRSTTLAPTTPPSRSSATRSSPRRASGASTSSPPTARRSATSLHGNPSTRART
jgi:hypothetical protein